MDRRSFLKKSALGGGAAAAASTLAAPLYAQGKRTLTMVTTMIRRSISRTGLRRCRMAT
jgi:TRAP-type mannitol/chloroaromatic compound transport system substrate-binding protein